MESLEKAREKVALLEEKKDQNRVKMKKAQLRMARYEHEMKVLDRQLQQAEASIMSSHPIGNGVSISLEWIETNSKTHQGFNLRVATPLLVFEKCMVLPEVLQMIKGLEETEVTHEAVIRFPTGVSVFLTPRQLNDLVASWLLLEPVAKAFNLEPLPEVQ